MHEFRHAQPFRLIHILPPLHCLEATYLAEYWRSFSPSLCLPHEVCSHQYLVVIHGLLAYVTSSVAGCNLIRFAIVMNPRHLKIQCTSPSSEPRIDLLVAFSSSCSISIQSSGLIRNQRVGSPHPTHKWWLLTVEQSC